MEKRKIGNSDLYCSSIGFGTWEMSSTIYGEIDINDIITNSITCLEIHIRRLIT